jgi:hypothetical protein
MRAGEGSGERLRMIVGEGVGERGGKEGESLREGREGEGEGEGD